MERETINVSYASAARAAKKNVLIVDDHPIVRQGLRLLIDREDDLRVCGEAEDGPAALRQIREAKPDIVVLDLSLEGPDGLEVLAEIRTAYPAIPVLVLSMLDEALYAERSLRAGASGYIMKQEATDKVLAAIRKILSGELHLSDKVAGKLLNQLVGGPAAVEVNPLAGLTNRELEVVRLIGKGLGTREIAQELHISIKTVESYQAHIKEKLSLRNARELLRFAIQFTTNGRQL